MRRGEVSTGGRGLLCKPRAAGAWNFFGNSWSTLTLGTTGTVEVFINDPGRGASETTTFGAVDISCLSSISLGFKSCVKETIGRPGAFETSVGVGSLGLLSFRRMLVAARISSPRISFPSFILTSGSFSASAWLPSFAFGRGGFKVYSALRDCVGGFR